MVDKQQPWYKKPRYIIGVSLGGILLVALIVAVIMQFAGRDTYVKTPQPEWLDSTDSAMAFPPPHG